MVVERQGGTVHLQMQQGVTGLGTAVNTHPVEMVLILAERVTGYRKDAPVAEVPLACRLRFIHHIRRAIVQIMSKVSGLIPLTEE